jgi:hypothetical protein
MDYIISGTMRRCSSLKYRGPCHHAPVLLGHPSSHRSTQSSQSLDMLQLGQLPNYLFIVLQSYLVLPSCNILYFSSFSSCSIIRLAFPGIFFLFIKGRWRINTSLEGGYLYDILMSHLYIVVLILDLYRCKPTSNHIVFFKEGQKLCLMYK